MDTKEADQEFIFPLVAAGGFEDPEDSSRFAYILYSLTNEEIQIAITLDIGDLRSNALSYMGRICDLYFAENYASRNVIFDNRKKTVLERNEVFNMLYDQAEKVMPFLNLKYDYIMK